MEPDKIIRIISNQRHDFLNHLSVISGLVQLNKVDLVPKYIVKVSDEIKSMRQVMYLKYPLTALALIAGYYQSAGNQVEVVYNVGWDFGGCPAPDEVVASFLAEITEQVLACLANPAAQGYKLEIILDRTPSFGSCTLDLAVEPDTPAGGLPETVAGISDGLAAYGGSAGMTARQGRLVINLLFPLAPEEGESGT